MFQTSVLVLIFVIFSYIFFSIIFYKIDENGRLSIEEILKESKEGDIIGFSGKTFGEKAIMWYWKGDDSVFEFEKDVNHVGVVVGGENKLLYEADIGQGEQEGVRLINLRKKLELWKGEKTFLLKRNINFNKDELSKNIKENLGKNVERAYWRWFIGLGSEKGKMYCYEVI